jgi:hypothetical protein
MVLDTIAVMAEDMGMHTIYEVGYNNPDVPVSSALTKSPIYSRLTSRPKMDVFIQSMPTSKRFRMLKHMLR